MEMFMMWVRLLLGQIIAIVEVGLELRAEVEAVVAVMVAEAVVAMEEVVGVLECLVFEWVCFYSS
jgi:hypothetical protein